MPGSAELPLLDRNHGIVGEADHRARPLEMRIEIIRRQAERRGDDRQEALREAVEPDQVALEDLLRPWRPSFRPLVVSAEPLVPAEIGHVGRQVVGETEQIEKESYEGR